MFNRELAERALKAIEANPQEWEQQAWRCDTGMCFAGFVAHAAGATWALPVINLDNPRYSNVITPNGREMDAALFAAEELGLTTRYATSLFDGGNTLKDIKELIALHSEEDGV